MHLYVIVGLLFTWNQFSRATADELSKEESDYLRNYAATMLSYMNTSVSPCNDFYEYACGNWGNVIERYDSLAKHNNLLEIDYKLNDVIANILQRPHINDLAPEYAAEFELAKKFYHNCQHTEFNFVRTSPEYLAVLKDIGGFPAVEADWNSENFDWLNMSAHLSNYNIENFVNEVIYPKYPFPPVFLIPKLGFDVELHYDNIKGDAYRVNAERMRYILTIYGVEETKIDSVVAEIFEFLEKILKVINDFDENPLECLLYSIKISDIVAIQKKWRAYYDIAWSGKTFPKSSQQIVCPVFYMKLDKICEENKRAAANYLSLKFLSKMNLGFRNKKNQNKFCISMIKSPMKYLLDHLYMKLHFNDKIHKDIHDVVLEIRHSLRENIKNAEWLDEITREAALLKESKIAAHIGRYEDPTVTKVLIGELKNLQFVTASFEGNYLNLRKFSKYMERFSSLNYEMANFSKPLQVLLGMEVHAAYYQLNNAIYVKAGILAAPVYNKAWPNSLKFGTLGSIVGHELSHAFDANDATYDESSHEKHEWWSDKSHQLFEERSQCYVNHYERYFIPEINRHINGELTKNENIADNVGLNAAFKAYRRSVQVSTAQYKREQMPGIDLSPEQLFFLGYAQIWCAPYEPMHYWEHLTAPHTIDKYRVLGALSNSNDFARAYNCPRGTKMNPPNDKCELW